MTDDMVREICRKYPIVKFQTVSSIECINTAALEISQVITPLRHLYDI